MNMKKNTIFSLILLAAVLFLYGCPKNGPVVYFKEDQYRNNTTFTFTPSFGNPAFKEGWRDEKDRLEREESNRVRNYAYDLGRWEAQGNIPFRTMAWRYFADHEDGYRGSRGRHVTSRSQLQSLMEEKGELDAIADIYGYPKNVYSDIVSDPYYQRGYSDYKVRYSRENESRERMHNRRAADWIADMHEWEAERDPRIDSTREYERLMYNLGILNSLADKYGYPQIKYP